MRHQTDVTTGIRKPFALGLTASLRGTCKKARLRTAVSNYGLPDLLWIADVDEQTKI